MGVRWIRIDTDTGDVTIPADGPGDAGTPSGDWTDDAIRWIGSLDPAEIERAAVNSLHGGAGRSVMETAIQHVIIPWLEGRDAE